MNLESQVISLDLAKRLYELAVKQESVFYWYEEYEDWLLHYIDYNHAEEDRKIFIKHNSPCYSAFTVAELFDMLPAYVDIKKEEPFNFFRFNMRMANITTTNKIEDIKRNYLIEYHCDTFRLDEEVPLFANILFKAYDSNLSNALAKTIVHLLENNLMKLPDEISYASKEEIESATKKTIEQYGDVLKNLAKR